MLWLMHDAWLNSSCCAVPCCAVLCCAVLCCAGGDGDEWVVLLASGIRGVGGAVLRFRSKHFTYGEKGGGGLQG